VNPLLWRAECVDRFFRTLDGKAFLRADLPPDHSQRANRRITETSHQPSQPQAVDVSHHSDAHLSDAESTGTISDPPVAHHEQ